MKVSIPAQRPPANPVRLRGGGKRECIELELKVVTPILGGAAQARTIDELDIIRVPGVRGCLRFWWRALYGSTGNPGELYERECGLWGGVTAAGGARSQVDVWLEVIEGGELDHSNVDQNAPGAYALWPARGEGASGGQPAPRRVPGTHFRLQLLCPGNRENEVRNTLRAWILFGGYGGRTRRGLGGLALVRDAEVWLPKAASRDEIAAPFGFDVFKSAGAPSPVPRLAGASARVGKHTSDANEAWLEALGWLSEFRQGTSGDKGNRAREPGAGKQQPKRPSVSNWPEADKMRCLTKKTASHEPRYRSNEPVWPRAGFGLPIQMRFQRKARDGGSLDEPDDFELAWRFGIKRTEPKRLASPLIVKALPLAGGTFAPCALWLARSYPAGAKVFAKRRNSALQNSEADFDELIAEGDTAQFAPLNNRGGLRGAFFEWLDGHHGPAVVAP